VSRDAHMLSSIQFLRFIAAAMVIASHSANVLGVEKTFTAGDSGVDIFFIISGFVIGLVGNTESSLPQFYLKRFIRVVPLYWVAMAVFFPLPHFMVDPEISVSNALHSLFLIPKFEAGWWPMLFPAWTLCYEVFFYAVFGIVILRKDAFWPVVIGLVMFSLITIPSNQSIFKQVVVLDFVAGLLVARFLPLMKRNEVLGVALIVCGAVTVLLNYKDVRIRVPYWGVPSLMIVLGCLHLENRAKKIPKVLGEASYSMYLFHITVMTTAREGFALVGINLKDHYAIGMMLLFTIAVPVGIGIHVLIEKPMLKFLRSALLRPGRNSVAGALDVSNQRGR
jgi:exopolysaccharide production protein ExoZ